MYTHHIQTLITYAHTCRHMSHTYTHTHTHVHMEKVMYVLYIIVCVAHYFCPLAKATAP